MIKNQITERGQDSLEQYAEIPKFNDDEAYVEQFDVSLTVHHSINLFLSPT
jgi:hypothetical protein